MRLLSSLFLLCGLAVNSWAAFASGTLAYYKNVGGNFVDVTGLNANLSLSGGTAPGVTTPIVGFGPYAAAAKHSLPAGLLTTLAGSSSYTIQYDAMYAASLPGNAFPWSAENGANDDYCNWFGASGVGVIRWVSSSGGSNILDTPSNTLQVSQTVKVAFTFDGTTKKIYLNDVLAASVVHSATFPVSAAAFHLGAAWPPSSTFPLTGYIGGVRFMSGTTIPIIDPSSNTVRSPYLKNYPKTKLGAK